MALTPVEEAQTRELLAQEAAILSLAASEPTIISKLGATKVNLSQLPAASIAADDDLLLIRQGSTDKSIAGSTIKYYTKPDYATETVSGVVELATTAEVQAGTDTTRAVTPAGLAAYVPVASATVAGKVELATVAEAQAGTDAVRAVTPSTLASVTATETRAGLVELATVAEAQAFTANKFIDGAKLAEAFKGSNYSLGTNCHQKLPSGLIIQWGFTGALAQNSSITVTMPFTFPGGSTYSVLATQDTISTQSTGVTATSINVHRVSGSQFYVHKGVNGGGVAMDGVIFWIAIGF